MTDKKSPAASLRKTTDTGASGADPVAGQPPRTVVYAAGALVLAGLSGMLASLLLLGHKDWVRATRHDAVRDAYKKIKSPSGKQTSDFKHDIDPANIAKYVDQNVRGVLITSVFTLLLLAFLGYNVYRGRHWSRWAVIGVWVLSTLTGALVGISSLLIIGSKGAPIAFKLPAFVAGIAFLTAVLLVCLRASVSYFALSRPDRGARPQRGGGLFGPRPQRQTRPAAASSSTSSAAGSGTRSPAVTRPAETKIDRSRTKARASSESVAKGADLARSRAKAASKSRRTGA